MYAALVSTISPSRISVPMDRISAFMATNVPGRGAGGERAAEREAEWGTWVREVGAADSSDMLAA